MKKEAREQRRLQMYHHIAAWQESGKTQKEFCEGIGEACCVFNYWLQKYKQDMQGFSAGFAEVIVPTRAPQLEIVYPNGTVLRLPAGTSPQTVRSYIGV